MANTETLYTARFELPELIERGRLQTLQCRVYRSGALAAPSSGTVTIYKADQSKLVDAAAVTVATSIATYALTAASTSTLAVEEGWLIEWVLVMPDSVTHTFRTDAALVRRRLYPTVTDADIALRWKALDPSSVSVITAQANYQDQLDAAWLDIQRRLIRTGNRPNLVIEPSALHECHLFLTGALIYEDLASRLNEAFVAHADRYRQQYEQAWNALRFRYDVDDDGTPDSTTKKRTPAGPLFLCSAGPRYTSTPWPR